MFIAITSIIKEGIVVIVVIVITVAMITIVITPMVQSTQLWVRRAPILGIIGFVLGRYLYSWVLGASGQVSSWSSICLLKDSTKRGCCRKFGN